MSKEDFIPLSAMHCAMVYRLAGEQPPEAVDGYRGMPCQPISERLAYLRRQDPDAAVALAQRLGYGLKGNGEPAKFLGSWVRSMLARCEAKIVQARTIIEKPDEVGPDGLTGQERTARAFAELWREGADRWPQNLDPPEL